jgi:hypothetical protein
MFDDHYPTIDLEFAQSLFENCDKVIDTIRVGETIAYIIKGLKPIGMRTVILRSTDGQVGFLYLSGYAARFGFMGQLLKWLEENRNWKDGGFTISPTGTE